MLRNTLISGVAAAAIGLAGAAFAQGSGSSSSSPSSSPSPNANPNATGTAPGLQNNRNDVPRGTPGSERAQERTGTSGSTTSQSSPGARGSGTVTGQTDTRSGGSRDNLTTGQVPQIQVSDQQRTQLRTSFQKANIRTVSRDQINVSIAVGSVLPSTVTFVPIPDPVLAIVPAFRGYSAVRVGDQILIVEPGTRRIVYIVQA